MISCRDGPYPVAPNARSLHRPPSAKNYRLLGLCSVENVELRKPALLHAVWFTGQRGLDISGLRSFGHELAPFDLYGSGLGRA